MRNKGGTNDEVDAKLFIKMHQIIISQLIKNFVKNFLFLSSFLYLAHLHPPVLSFRATYSSSLPPSLLTPDYVTLIGRHVEP